MTRAGEFGEVDGASAADAGGGGLVGGDAGKLREELAGMDEERFDCGMGRNSRSLHCASLSLRESEAPVGMTIIHLSLDLAVVGMTIIELSFIDLTLIDLTIIELSLDLTLVELRTIDLTFDLFEGVGLCDVELGYGGAAEGFEVGSAA